MRHLAWFGLVVIVGTFWGIAFGTLDYFLSAEAGSFIARALVGVLTLSVLWKVWMGSWAP